MSFPLPIKSFMGVARDLDNLSLRKRRLEVLQMLEACIRGENNPGLKPWKGLEVALCHFGMCCCYVWKERGNQDGLYEQFREKLATLPIRYQYYPPWFERLHN